MEQFFTKNANNAIGTVALPQKAYSIVSAEAARRSAAGEPGDSNKAVAGEYIIGYRKLLDSQNPAQEGI